MAVFTSQGECLKGGSDTEERWRRESQCAQPTPAKCGLLKCPEGCLRPKGPRLCPSRPGKPLSAHTTAWKGQPAPLLRELSFSRGHSLRLIKAGQSRSTCYLTRRKGRRRLASAGWFTCWNCKNSGGKSQANRHTLRCLLWWVLNPEGPWACDSLRVQLQGPQKRPVAVSLRNICKNHPKAFCPHLMTAVDTNIKYRLKDADKMKDRLKPRVSHSQSGRK